MVLVAGEYGGELEVLVGTTAVRVDCPGCGARASSHGRREHLLRDVPTAGRPALLVWRKRVWLTTGIVDLTPAGRRGCWRPSRTLRRLLRRMAGRP